MTLELQLNKNLMELYIYIQMLRSPKKCNTYIKHTPSHLTFIIVVLMSSSSLYIHQIKTFFDIKIKSIFLLIDILLKIVINTI